MRYSKEKMRNFLAILSSALLLFACSDKSNDTIVDPDLHPVRLNTGELLSMDGGHVHLAFDYDAEGRVVRAERFDTTWYASIRSSRKCQTANTTRTTTVTSAITTPSSSWVEGWIAWQDTGQDQVRWTRTASSSSSVTTSVVNLFPSGMTT